MKFLIKFFASTLLSLSLMIGGNVKLQANAIVWGLNPVSGDIVRINPKNGEILGSFPAPVKPSTPFDPLVDPFPPPLKPFLPDSRAGLSIADHGRTLLYQLGNNGPQEEEYAERLILYGLDPFTGDIKYQVSGLFSSFGPDGLSWQSQGGNSFTFFAHANPIPDIHRVENIGSPEEHEEPFWGPTYYQGSVGNFPVGGLGGDGNGREFGAFLDSFNEFDGHLYIGEYDPFNNVDFLNRFIAPADDIEGLAFDGRFLYASSSSGGLYTLNPETGEIVNSVFFPPLFFSNGDHAPYYFDIAAAVPEPTQFMLISLGIMGLSIVVRRNNRGRLT